MFEAIGYVLCCCSLNEPVCRPQPIHSERPINPMLFYGNRKFVFFIEYDVLRYEQAGQFIQVSALSIVVMLLGPVCRNCDTVGRGDKWSIQYSLLE